MDGPQKWQLELRRLIGAGAGQSTENFIGIGAVNGGASLADAA
jgi:hypothetical protein